MFSSTLIFGTLWWVALVLAVPSALLAWYSYRITVPPITTARRTVLVCLRTIGLWMILLILSEPLLRLVSAREEDPHIAIILDNSLSAGMRDAGFDRTTIYRTFLQQARIAELESKAKVYLFDARTRELSTFANDSVTLTGQFSNIHQALTDVGQTADRDNIRSVLLLTDGAYNAGDNPLYSAELLARPITTIGIGDTTLPKDVALLSVIANDIGYKNVPTPIVVNLRSVGFGNNALRVVLKDDDVVIGEQIITPRSAQETLTAQFDYTPTADGTRKITAEIAPLADELTEKNNIVSRFMRVLKDKRSFVMICGMPSPDVSFLRNLLSDNSTEIKTFVQKSGDTFYDFGGREGILTKDILRSAECIIMVGFPTAQSGAATIELLREELAQNKPLLFIAGRETDYQKARAFDAFLPFTVASFSQQEVMVQAQLTSKALASPAMKIQGTDDDATQWEALPPIFRTELFARAKPEAEVLATIKIGTTPVNEPLIIQRTGASTRVLAVLGYGLFRWRLMGFAADRSKGKESIDILSLFINNSARWITAGDQGKRMRISATRDTYAQGETAELVAQVYDQSYAPADNADVRVQLTLIGSSNANDKREIVLTGIGNGRYTAQIQGLRAGEYSFSGNALYRDILLGEDAGRFTIGNVALEYQDQRMNSTLLKEIAERTGGKFYSAHECNPSQILQDMISSPEFVARPITEQREIPLWTSFWTIAFAILAFSLEWWIRKQNGMM